MSRQEVIALLIKEKILVLDNGKYILTSKYVPKTSKIDENFELLLENYREIWPKGIKSGGRLVRKSIANLRPKLGLFVKQNPAITFDEIIDATAYYIKGFKATNYAYMACGDYFIFKNRESGLLDVVEAIREGDIKPQGSENFVTSLN